MNNEVLEILDLMPDEEIETLELDEQVETEQNKDNNSFSIIKN